VEEHIKNIYFNIPTELPPTETYTGQEKKVDGGESNSVITKLLPIASFCQLQDRNYRHDSRYVWNFFLTYVSKSFVPQFLAEPPTMFGWK
jgi:hypothetical protein